MSGATMAPAARRRAGIPPQIDDAPVDETGAPGKDQTVPIDSSAASAATQPYAATILRCQGGHRLAKLYHDPNEKPDDYDAGLFFDAVEIEEPTFAAFVDTLAEIDADMCLIRGAVKSDARPDVEAGAAVRRLAHDRDGCLAAFKPVERNWIVLDVDTNGGPFDPSDVEGSVAAWRETLPDEIRAAQSAFFLSASAHRSTTVRGKLVVALAEPLDNDSAAAWAKAHGFDPSVCHTVSINYFAPPLFKGCEDPLASHRAPIVFDGEPAQLPALPPGERRALSSRREAVPDDLPPLSDDARELAATIHDRWLDGGRIETHAWLHLAGWALGKGWPKGELGALLVELDADEPDSAKRAEHWHVLGNARTLDGPGGAREWLDEDFAAVDAIVGRRGAGDVMDRLLARWRGRFAATAPANDGGPGHAPMIVIPTNGNSIFVRQDDRNEYRECGARAFRVLMIESGLSVCLTDEKGKDLRDAKVIETNATSCDAVETDFTRNGRAVWDDAGRRILIGVTPKAVESRPDSGVEAWLRCLAGDKLPALHEWVAGTHQRHIHRPATALALIGEHGVGKTLIAIACARLWGAPDPVPMSAVVAQFNASIATCPIVVDDECEVLTANGVTTEAFRTLVQRRTRQYEPKGKERRTLHGSQRFVLTANDLGGLRFSNSVGHGAVDAIAERLLLVHVHDANVAREALDRLRLDDGEIDFDRLEGHLAWVQANVTVPNARQRFIGSDPDKEGAKRAALASTVEANAEVFEHLRGVLLGEGAGPNCFVAASALWLRPGDLASGHDWRRDVRKAVAPFQVRGRRGVKRGGRSVRAVCLDVDRLCLALDVDPAAVVETPDAEAPEAPPKIGSFAR